MSDHSDALESTSAPKAEPAGPKPEENTGEIRTEGWAVIHTYSRAQAIADGALVDLMQPETAQLVHEAGFKFPMAMTIGAFSETIGALDTELPPGQDFKGRLWDVLWLLKCAIRTNPESTDRVFFSVKVWGGRRHKEVKLWSLIGPGDTPEPVITIMLEGED